MNTRTENNILLCDQVRIAEVVTLLGEEKTRHYQLDFLGEALAEFTDVAHAPCIDAPERLHRIAGTAAYLGFAALAQASRQAHATWTEGDQQNQIVLLEKARFIAQSTLAETSGASS